MTIVNEDDCTRGHSRTISQYNSEGKAHIKGTLLVRKVVNKEWISSDNNDQLVRKEAMAQTTCTIKSTVPHVR